MSLLSSGITHGQAVSLILLCVFLVLFIIFDIFLVLTLRRKNKKLADKINTVNPDKNAEEGTRSNNTDEGQV